MNLERLARQRRGLLSIVLVVAVAIPAAFYILGQERLRAPWSSNYTVSAEFTNATAVASGLGEPVNVAGVHVGQIAGESLQDGHAVLRLEIDPHQLPRVYANARATLVPNTPLKDMQVDLDPGSPPAPVMGGGDVIPLARTTTPIDSDELLSALDTDTRDWLVSLISGYDTGTRGRVPDMRALLHELGPTAAQAREIAHLLAGRRVQLRRLTHNLAVLTHAAGSQDTQLGEVVDAGNATLSAMAGQDVALRRSIAQLPGTLGQARVTLGHVRGLARAMRPALGALLPTARRLPATLRDSRPLLEGGAGLPIRSLPPFTRALLPLAQRLTPLTRDLSAQTGPLTEAFGVLGQTVNEMAYNPGGADQGYLFWLSWFAHNVDSVFSTEDANGAAVRGLTLVSCSSLTQPAGSLLQVLLGVTPPAGGCGP